MPVPSPHLSRQRSTAGAGEEGLEGNAGAGLCWREALPLWASVLGAAPPMFNTPTRSTDLIVQQKQVVCAAERTGGQPQDARIQGPKGAVGLTSCPGTLAHPLRCYSALF